MHGFQNNLAQLFISTPLQSFTIIAYAIPWHLHVRPHNCIHRDMSGTVGLLGSVFVFLSISLANVRARLMILCQLLFLDETI